MSTERQHEEDEQHHGHDLKGHARGQDARRRWYFSHHEHFERLRQHHRDKADEHRQTAAKPTAEELARDIRRRNQARADAYHAELREYEDRRLEREEAKAEWSELIADIKDRHGGIKPSSIGEDYRDLPVTVRSTRGDYLDNVAEHYGFDNADEFVRFVRSTHDRARRAETEKLPRPKKPEYEKEPRQRLSVPTNPELRGMLSEIKETKAMIRAGETELGKNHPALDDLKDALRELKRDYAEAARKAGGRPARL